MQDMDSAAPAVPLDTVLAVLIGILMGTLLVAVVAPHWIPGLAASLTEPHPKAYWYLSRASGFVAYALLWMSTALGLVITSRTARLWPGGVAAVDLHQFAALMGIAFSLFHVLVLLGDRYAGYTLMSLLAPFASTEYRPLWVGLGQVGLYVGIVTTFSFYVRKRIGPRAWRRLHYGTFVLYFLVTVHSLAAGTDATAPPVLVAYGLAGTMIYFLTVYRILGRPSPPRRLPTGQHRER